MAAKVWLLCVALFLVLHRIHHFHSSTDRFRGLSHIAGIRFSPEIQPCVPAVAVELARRRNCFGTAFFRLRPYHGKPPWLAGCLLLMCEEVEVNPGPVRFPCGRCDGPVASNHRGLCCDDCDKWWHMKCAGVSANEYRRLGQCCDLWLCPVCCLPPMTDSYFNTNTTLSLSHASSKYF